MFNAPAPDHFENLSSYEDSLEEILEATEHAENGFVKLSSLPDVREPLENNFFDDDDSLEFS